MSFLDPVQAIAQQEREARLPFVFPEKFYTKYREMPDGSRKAEDWVSVKKKGLQNGQVTPHRWRDIERDPDMLTVLKPYYDNWKAGQAPPVSGTPLDVWIADANLIEVLNSVNIRSVEDFSGMEDHLLTKLNIPNLRERQRRARAFLDAQASTAKVSAEVSIARAENESLKAEIAELRALIEKHAVRGAPQKAAGALIDSPKGNDTTGTIEEFPKRPRGRPRKNPIEIN